MPARRGSLARLRRPCNSCWMRRPHRSRASPTNQMTWKGPLHSGGVGEFFGSSGLKTGKPVHRDDFHRVSPRLGALGQPSLEHLCSGCGWTMTNSRAEPAPGFRFCLVPCSASAGWVDLRPGWWVVASSVGVWWPSPCLSPFVSGECASSVSCRCRSSSRANV